MSDPDQPVSASGTHDDGPAERLAQHLLLHPYDLIDVRRLFPCLQVTTQEFQRALTRFGDLRLTGNIQPAPA